MNAALPQETAAQLQAWDNPMGLMLSLIHI